MSEVVTFIPDAGGSIVINGKCFLSNQSYKRYFRYKIGLKAEIYLQIFFSILVILRDAFQYNEIVVLRQKCRTKFSDYGGEPYSIGISANGEL